MKYLVAVFVSAFAFTANVYAADSTMLLCESGRQVLTVFEHRSSAATRATDINFIYGGYALSGDLDDVNESNTFVMTGKNGSFNGSIAIDYQTRTVLIDGQFFTGGTLNGTKLVNLLYCRDLQ